MISRKGLPHIPGSLSGGGRSLHHLRVFRKFAGENRNEGRRGPGFANCLKIETAEVVYVSGAISSSRPTTGSFAISRMCQTTKP